MAGFRLGLSRLSSWEGLSSSLFYRKCFFKYQNENTTKVTALLTHAIKRAMWTRFIKTQNSPAVSFLVTGRPLGQRRWMSTEVKHNQQHKDSDPSRGNPYHLMNFPEVMWPSIFKSIKNYIFTYLVVRPYLDNDFTLDEFMKGSKHAFVYVSKLISQGDFDNLKGLVADEALKEIRKNYEKMDAQHRQHLSFESEDVYFAFPYQLGIMFDENTQPQKRFAEITVCFHCFRGFEEIRKRDPGLGSMYEHRDAIVVCNYRFIREYTKGVNDNWIINRLNHFKPVVV